RLEIALRGVTQMVAIGGDIRLAASQILAGEPGNGVREISREAFLAFCDDVERLDDDSLVNRFRLPVVEAETLVPGLFLYRALLGEPPVRRIIVCDASLRTGVLLDLLEPTTRQAADDFERQVLASAESLGQRYRFDRSHGRHVAMLSTRLFDEMRD